jgi:hypothetical protein
MPHAVKRSATAAWACDRDQRGLGLASRSVQIGQLRLCGRGLEPGNRAANTPRIHSRSASLHQLLQQLRQGRLVMGHPVDLLHELLGRYSQGLTR